MNNIKLLTFFCLFFVFNLLAEDTKIDALQNSVEETKDLQTEINVNSELDVVDSIVPSGNVVDISDEEKFSDEKLVEEVVPLFDEDFSDVEEEPVAETVDLSEEKIGTSGNWVKKREWVKESYLVNEEIQSSVSEIQKLREPFQNKFIKIDGELDSFYKQEGFKYSRVKVLFNGLNRYLDKKRKKEVKKLKSGVTGEEEIKIDILLENIKNSKNETEQLRLDIKSIDDLDKSLNDRLKKLDEYIKLSLDESLKSKEMIDEVWYIIDDLKARDIFYQLKGDSLEKINAIKRYLTGTFSTDFNNYLKVIRDQIEKVSNSIKGLEEKGLIIKNRSERLEEIKLKDLESNEDIQEEQKPEKTQRFVDRSFFQKAYYFLVNVVANIHNFLSEL